MSLEVANYSAILYFLSSVSFTAIISSTNSRALCNSKSLRVHRLRFVCSASPAYLSLNQIHGKHMRCQQPQLAQLKGNLLHFYSIDRRAFLRLHSRA
jgi:hypothetical protein